MANFYERLIERWDLNRAFLRLPSGAVLTYGEVAARTDRLATGLAIQGVEPGDRVLSLLSKRPSAVGLYLACLKVGAAFVPVNPAYTAAELGYLVDDADPALVVTDNSPATSSGRSEISVDSLAKKRGGPVPRVFDAGGGELASLIYTSGTTGRPKGSMLTHDNLAVNALDLVDLWHYGRADVLVHALPIFHVHGLFVALHCAMLTGSEVIFLPGFDQKMVSNALSSATVMMGVPTFYHRLLQERSFGPEAGGMRLFVSGSAPLPAGTHREFEARTGHQILERYGMSEAGMICSNPYEGERVPGTVGYPLPNVEVRLAAGPNTDESDSAGVLEIRGPNVCTGYWRRPKTEGFTSGGFFSTGDIARIAADGRVTLEGRATDLIITGGMNVYPMEVESVLTQVAGAGEVAVIGLPHPDFGEAVVAFHTGSARHDSLAAAAATSLAPYKRPKRFVLVEELPRNAMGKIQKSVLRSEHASLLR